MKIDIQKIIADKIEQMEKDKIVEKKIEERVENAILEAIEQAIDVNSIRDDIESIISKEVREGISKIGFTAYNTLIFNEMERVIKETIKDDIAEKISKVFEDILINKKKSIKLSEIVEEYRMLYENIDYDTWERMENGCFDIIWKEETNFIKLTFSQFPQKYHEIYVGSNDKKIYISMFVENELQEDGTNIKIGEIISAEFEGKILKDFSRVRSYMSDFEALMLNVVLNNTKIVIDIEESGIDTTVGEWR